MIRMHPSLIGNIELEHWPILALSTLPFLAVSIYVLYDAHYRTAAYTAARNIDDDDEDVSRDFGGLSLAVLLYLFLLAFIVLSTLLAYYGHFMAKRLELLEHYTKTGYIVNGNHHPNARLGWWRLLDYVQCRFAGRYDRLVYAHPSPSAAGLVGMPAAAQGSTARGNQEGWVVEKLIRRSRAVMDRQRQLHGDDAKGQQLSRPIVLLPDLPHSGMIQEDVEYDAAFLSHFRSSRRHKETLLVVGFWMAFTLFSAIFLLGKMGEANVTRDSRSNGIAALLIVVFAITPAVALGYNRLRWAMHKQFTTNSGKARQGRIMNGLPLCTDSEEEIEMGHVCGAGYYSEMTQ